MDAGQLRTQITIHRLRVEPQDFGEVDPPADIICRTWAKFEAISGSEQNINEQLQSVVHWRVTMRFNPQITTDMEVRRADTQKKFAIKAITDKQQRGEYLILHCTENQA